MTRNRIGGIMQLGYVVDDLDAAIAHWTGKLHVGPFFVTRHASYSQFEYMGGTAAPDLSLAFAFSGDTNIEFIQQHDDTASPFLDFRQKNGAGLQHIGVLSDDLAGDTQLLESQNSEMVLRLTNGGSGIETRFFDTELYPGMMLELIGRSPTLDAGFAAMKAAARSWDGMQIIAG